ncbi:Pentatricopeptide repeat, partial [Dillenia turbinata]
VMYACGKYNLVHEFFRKMQKSCTANALTYKVLINTLWGEGKTDEAILAVQEMERRGIIGSASLYYDLARCLCSAGRCQEALAQIDKICKVANKPLVVTYTGLIQACLESGRVQDGAYIFGQMRGFCKPNLVTCNIMLKAYLGHAMFDEANNLFHNMLEDGNKVTNKADYKDRVTPDIYTFNIMLDACVSEKRWEDLEYIFQQMLQHGYYISTKHHVGMILDACRAGKGELVELTWKHLTRADQVPPPSLVKERFLLKLEEDDYDAALYSLRICPLSGLRAFSKKAWLNLLEENSHRVTKDALVGLIQKIVNSIAADDSQKIVFQNLVSSCREFLWTNMLRVKTDQTDVSASFSHAPLGP